LRLAILAFTQARVSEEILYFLNVKQVQGSIDVPHFHGLIRDLKPLNHLVKGFTVAPLPH
jgi:hypothetical protein